MSSDSRSDSYNEAIPLIQRQDVVFLQVCSEG